MGMTTVGMARFRDGEGGSVNDFRSNVPYDHVDWFEQARKSLCRMITFADFDQYHAHE
jgi:hypothetical protein